MNAPDYERIAAAIDFLVEHRGEQPSLEEAARRAGFSSFHFQRLFKKYAGVTPKQFLAALTLQSAKPLLDGDASVLDAALEVGLSSPSRLHEHFVSIDAMSPGEYKAKGRGLIVTYGFAHTPFGILSVARTDRGIAMIDFVERPETFDPSETPLSEAAFERNDDVAERVASLVFGAGPRFERLHIHGTNFQLRVWNALLHLAPGERVTYKQVADAIGEPTAARAVGNAVAVNPIAVLVPCHRVIAGSGVIGNYKWGSQRKRALLAWETARAQIESACATTSDSGTR